MTTIRLLDARRGLNLKCRELFRDEKIADEIYRYLCDGIEECEDAEPEREKGEWEEIEVIPEAYDIAGVKTWASKMRCNQCGFTTSAIEGRFAQYNFCPNCGADMRGELNER